MQLPVFKIRASAASEILAGTIGLTEAQQVKLNELSTRKASAMIGEAKPLTPNMENELSGLLYKEANPELPQGAKTYCEKWLKEKLYDRRKNFANKYLEKGIACEDDSINFAAKVFDWGAVSKNEEWFSDDWMEGTPDVVANIYSEATKWYEPTIIDMKNVWDCFTMPLFEDAIPTEAYETQLQVYMHLVSNEYQVDYNDAILCYALMDAPADVMQKEMRRLSWEDGHQGLITPEIGERVRREMTYSNLAPELRLRTYNVKRNNAVIEELKVRVKLCRKYIAKLIEVKSEILKAA